MFSKEETVDELREEHLVEEQVFEALPSTEESEEFSHSEAELSHEEEPEAPGRKAESGNKK